MCHSVREYVADIAYNTCRDEVMSVLRNYMISNSPLLNLGEKGKICVSLHRLSAQVSVTM